MRSSCGSGLLASTTERFLVTHDLWLIDPRTQEAVWHLREEGFVDARSSLRDCRTCYFFVSRDCVEHGALEDARERAQEAVRAGKLVEQV